MDGMLGFGSQLWLCDAIKGRGQKEWKNAGTTTGETKYFKIPSNKVIHVQDGLNQDLGDYEWTRTNISLTGPKDPDRDRWPDFCDWVKRFKEGFQKVREGKSMFADLRLDRPWIGLSWIDFGVEAGFTISLKNFQSVRATIGLEARADDSLSMIGVADVAGWVIDRLIKEEAECSDSRQTKKAIFSASKHEGISFPDSIQLARVSLMYGLTVNQNGRGFRRLDAGDGECCLPKDVDATLEGMAAEFKRRIGAILR